MKHSKMSLISLVLSMIALLVACTALVCALQPCQVVSTAPQAAAGAPALYSAEWFRTPVASMPGKPYIALSCTPNPVHAVEHPDFPDGKGWMYNIQLTETNGIPFHVDSLTQYSFNASGECFPATFTSDQIAAWWGGSAAVPAGQMCTFGNGMPVQDIACQGISVQGRSPDGTVMEFHMLVEFNPELAP